MPCWSTYTRVTLSGSSMTGSHESFEYKPPGDARTSKGRQDRLARASSTAARGRVPDLDEIRRRRKLGNPGRPVAGRHRAATSTGRSELEMPTGVVATLGKYIPMQNARMIQMLCSQHGASTCSTTSRSSPLPPDGLHPGDERHAAFGYWEKRPKAAGFRRTAPTRACSCRRSSSDRRARSSFKDEDGLYTDDPKKNRPRPTSRGSPRRS